MTISRIGQNGEGCEGAHREERDYEGRRVDLARLVVTAANIPVLLHYPGRGPSTVVGLCIKKEFTACSDDRDGLAEGRETIIQLSR